VPTTSPLRPTSSINSAFGANTHLVLDDVVTQPSAGGTSDIVSLGEGILVQQYGVDRVTTPGIIQSATIWAYVRPNDSNTDGFFTTGRVRLNGVWRSASFSGMPSVGAWGWVSCIVTGEFGELTGATPQFEITYNGSTPDASTDIAVTYLEIVYYDVPTISGAPVLQGVAVTHFSANQTTHVVNLPSGIAAGDLLYLWFNKDGGTGTITTPSGWSIAVSTITATDQSILFVKTASGSEGTTVSVTTSFGESSSCIAYRVSGWSEVVYNNTTVSLSAYWNAPSVTATETAGAIVLALASAAGGTVEPVEMPQGPIAWSMAMGNTADPGNTVMAYGQAIVVYTNDGVEVFSFPWRYSANTSGRFVSVVVHGTAASGSSGVSDPLFAGLVL
jgi:hypothetical protein